MKRIAKMNKKEVCECKCCHHLRLNFHKVRPQKNTGLFGKFSQMAAPPPPPPPPFWEPLIQKTLPEAQRTQGIASLT